MIMLHFFLSEINFFFYETYLFLEHFDRRVRLTSYICALRFTVLHWQCIFLIVAFAYKALLKVNITQDNSKN